MSPYNSFTSKGIFNINKRTFLSNQQHLIELIRNEIEFISYSYDSSTGVFTVPSGRDGLYYVSTYLLVSADGEFGIFSIMVNGVIVCTAYGDHSSLGSDVSQATCSAVVDVVEGIHISRNGILLSYYRPQTKLREGNVFTGVCLSTGEGCIQWAPSEVCTPPRSMHVPHQSTGRWYASFWNASLFYFDFCQLVRNTSSSKEEETICKY